jgi:long-chain acyl-CoA synthetase
MWDFERYANQIAVIDNDEQEITYGKLQELGRNLSHYLPKRCLVLQLCGNTLGSLIGYTAFVQQQHVPIMLDQDIDPVLLAQLRTSYAPDMVWVPLEKRVLFPDSTQLYSAWGYVLLQQPRQQVRLPLYADLALLLTTSGSTGSVKLVRLSSANLTSNTSAIVQCLQLDATERAITTLPMHYTYGLSIINTHLSVGASIVLSTHSVMQREFWTRFEQHQVTSLAGVPYTYEMLMKLRFTRRILPSLRTLTQAGGKLSPNLHQALAEYAVNNGKHFIVMYGATEATARMAYLPAERALDKCGAIGIAVPGGRFSLQDAEQVDITEDACVGELIYHGPNVMLGYAKQRADLSLGDTCHGVLATGDLAQRDAEGFYTIVGRKKRFLKIFGNRVSLDETEWLIKAQFPDIDCACVGRDDAMQIYVTGTMTMEEIKRFIVQKTQLHSSAFTMHAIVEIPKNAAGKTLYATLEADNG